jgi:hypothetical protein
MVLFIQIYMWFSIALPILNFIIAIADLDIKSKTCFIVAIILNVLWMVYSLIYIIISLIY